MRPVARDSVLREEFYGKVFQKVDDFCLTSFGSKGAMPATITAVTAKARIRLEEGIEVQIVGSMRGFGVESY